MESVVSETVMRRLLIACLILAAAGPARAEEKAEGIEFFEKKIRPLFVKHCYECHSADAKKLRGELHLDTRAGVLKGGATGPAIVAGHPDKSLLIRAVKHADDMLRMPKEKLSDDEIADLIAWVKMGAPDPRTGAAASKRLDLVRARDFWAFKPVVRPAVPKLATHHSPLTTSVDAFILDKLEAKGLTPAPPADKRTLIRRATYDLTGLPPTPEEIEAFLKDESHEAFAKVVDRLLASSAYGERWGRHWLDVVRYSDTAGDNSDYPIPQIHRYRDWVIAAFNRDMPYDEFIRRQLAGDLLNAKDEDDRYANLIATGRALPVVPHLRGHNRQPRPHVPRPHHQLRPLPRSQVRPDQPGGLLRSLRLLFQHALPAAGDRARQGATRFRAARAGREGRCS
jgi:mono/diheme cytochrome c family protein